VEVSLNAAIGLSGTCGKLTCGGGAVSISGSATLQADHGSLFINNRLVLLPFRYARADIITRLFRTVDASFGECCDVPLAVP
jgi:hypothetical protein